jgi:hypothetical protein
MSIEPARNGSLAKNKKLNEVIKSLNSLINMSVREGSEGEAPTFTFGELQSQLVTTTGKSQQAPANPDSGGSGGLPDGFVETEVNMCINGEEETVTLLIKFASDD